ncbi:flavin reductase [Plantactinospora sp. CA-294935]|uniref:flavin reductase n=1 Tax=Plantactinospora sp. CA-294935 TaxID=3240012 RepID=UPI003D8C9CA6
MIGPQERWYRFAARRRRRTGAHVPAHPSYRCRDCDDAWPCPQARLCLLIGFQGDRVGLMVYLAAHLARALEELPDTHPALIAGQLLHWVPRRY